MPSTSAASVWSPSKTGTSGRSKPICVTAMMTVAPRALKAATASFAASTSRENSSPAIFPEKLQRRMRDVTKPKMPTLTPPTFFTIQGFR